MSRPQHLRACLYNTLSGVAISLVTWSPPILGHRQTALTVHLVYKEEGASSGEPPPFPHWRCTNCHRDLLFDLHSLDSSSNPQPFYPPNDVFAFATCCTDSILHPRHFASASSHCCNCSVAISAFASFVIGRSTSRKCSNLTKCCKSLPLNVDGFPSSLISLCVRVMNAHRREFIFLSFIALLIRFFGASKRPLPLPFGLPLPFF